jgi:CRP-like cAMP-binding protein
MRTSSLSQLDGSVKTKLLSDLKKYRIFGSWPDKGKFLERFTAEGKVNIYSPHYHWAVETDTQLSIVLDGLIAVHYDDAAPEVVSSFLMQGQLIGEFELMKIPRNPTRLIALTETTVFEPSKRVISNLRKDLPHYFYPVLASSLASKMYHKNEIIELLGRQKIINRLIYLLSSFKDKESWAYLTEYPSEDRNFYNIAVTWSHGNLETVLSTQFRYVREALATLVRKDAIQVECLIKAHDSSGDQVSAAALMKQQKGFFYRIAVCDRSRLDNCKQETKESKEDLI